MSGQILYCSICGPTNGADGTTALGVGVGPLGGISGIQATRARFLEGVFLGPAPAQSPAPPSLVFTDFAFDVLSPVIAQQFFMGDGLTGNGIGDIQRFIVPDGATRLYLGFTDWISGTCIGAWDDNTGEIRLGVETHGCLLLTSQPSSSLACPEGTAAFAVSTSSASNVAVQWQVRAPEGTWQPVGRDPVSLSCGGASSATAVPLIGNTVIVSIRPCPGPCTQPQRFSVRGEVTNQCGTILTNEAAYTICPADINCTGELGLQDLFDFLTFYFSGHPRADFNCAGGVTLQDVFDFLVAYFTGCP